MRNNLADVLTELQRIENGGSVDDELLDLIEMIADILGGLKEVIGMTEKEKTAPVVSVGADTEQSILKQTNNSITDFNENDKSLFMRLEV